MKSVQDDCYHLSAVTITHAIESFAGIIPARRRIPHARVAVRFVNDFIVVSELTNTNVLFCFCNSMIECETACDRIGIMAFGRLKCLGSLQRLRRKFGTGYTIKMKLKESVPDAFNSVKEAVKGELPAALLKDVHQVSCWFFKGLFATHTGCFSKRRPEGFYKNYQSHGRINPHYHMIYLMRNKAVRII